MFVVYVCIDIYIYMYITRSQPPNKRCQDDNDLIKPGRITMKPTIEQNALVKACNLAGAGLAWPIIYIYIVICSIVNMYFLIIIITIIVVIIIIYIYIK